MDGGDGQRTEVGGGRLAQLVTHLLGVGRGSVLDAGQGQVRWKGRLSVG